MRDVLAMATAEEDPCNTDRAALLGDGGSRELVAGGAPLSKRRLGAAVAMVLAAGAFVGGAAHKFSAGGDGLLNVSEFHPIALAAQRVLEATEFADCREGDWPGRGARCGSCRVVVASFEGAAGAGRRLAQHGHHRGSRPKQAEKGTCHEYCKGVGRFCKGGWMTELPGSCTAVWEYEQSCNELMPPNKTICLCGAKVAPAIAPTIAPAIAPAKHTTEVPSTEAPSTTMVVTTTTKKEELAPEKPKALECNPAAEKTDFWTKSMLFTIPAITSMDQCNRKCYEIDKCGAWTWGKEQGVPGLSNVCFIKVVGADGMVDMHPNPKVVSGMKSYKDLCSDSESKAFFQAQLAWDEWKAKHVDDESSTTKPKDEQPGDDAQIEIKKEKEHKGDVEDDEDVDTSEDEVPMKLDGPPGHIKSRHGNCLTVIDSNISIWACAKDDARQTWALDDTTGQMKNTQTGLCLHSLARAIEFTALNVEKCDSFDWDQQWDYLEESGSLQSWKGICVDGAESVIDGGSVYMRACSKASPGQQWDFNLLENMSPMANPGVKAGTSLFCIALMLPHTYEQQLLAMQYQNKVSLFACEAYQVLSNGTYQVAPGLTSGAIDSSLQCKKGGEFGTALNLPIFIAVWEKVIHDGIYLKHDWVVKVDPDAVFFADRLRGIVTVHYERPSGVYLNNCKYGLHGPIEVFSKNAITAWAKGYKTCQAHFWNVCQGDCFWGEDLFIDQCLWKVLNVTRENDYRQLVEDHCDAPVKNWTDYTCEDATHAAFHPFKNKETYMKCLQAANAKTLEVPLQ